MLNLNEIHLIAAFKTMGVCLSMVCLGFVSHGLAAERRADDASGHSRAAGCGIVHEGRGDGSGPPNPAGRWECIRCGGGRAGGAGGDRFSHEWRGQRCGGAGLQRSEKKVYSVNAEPRAPKLATIDWYEKNNGGKLPDSDGLLSGGLPGVVDAWYILLDRWGTMSFAQVLQPAIELAENGFP